MTPEMIVALFTGITGFVTALGAQVLAFRQLRAEIREKASETQTVVEQKTGELNHQVERAAEINALQINVSNSFNTKISKLQDQNSLIWRHLKALEKVIGIEIQED